MIVGMETEIVLKMRDVIDSIYSLFGDSFKRKDAKQLNVTN
ncbi:hypothetical protein LX69_02227 [Breznakibacter xylanolyticus]|uniref:Uncharacterized protein n=1 Tax=Breznakibacter xylanolyticus TaxID=990 RepID=A0A2W7Q031_9BACT|nr:hypothetical protein LX69_02227 [Breznakibacter xylanolyticus]